MLFKFRMRTYCSSVAALLVVPVLVDCGSDSSDGSSSQTGVSAGTGAGAGADSGGGAAEGGQTGQGASGGSAMGGGGAAGATGGGDSCDQSTSAEGPHAPGRPVEPFGYGWVRQVLATAEGPGMNGAWWCTNHFGSNLGCTWSCQSVSGGHSCEGDVPQGELVSCVRADAPATVDESAFAEKACNSDDLDAASKEFCAGTDYMTTRTASTLYLYNDWLRAGLNRSYGGTLMELYGTNGWNVLQQHGGSAVQLSVWGYDATSGAPAWFTTQQPCNPNGFADAGTCKTANGGNDCRFFGTGEHVSNCSTELSCFDWTAAGPWNPIQAQAEGCGWNGPTNDVDTVVGHELGVTMTRENPYNFTKTTELDGMTWSVTGQVLPDRPYLQLDYVMDYDGKPVGVHNQEIPALFTDDRMGKYYYFYSGGSPYADAAGDVTRVALADVASQQLALPDRTGEKPQTPPANGYRNATEEWLSSCDATETHCLTVATFAPDVSVLYLDGHYVTPMGRFAFNGHRAWTIYLFPYRHDDVVAGKTVREWIYAIRSGD